MITLGKLMTLINYIKNIELINKKELSFRIDTKLEKMQGFLEA
jgi:hypothetical protein